MNQKICNGVLKKSLELVLVAHLKENCRTFKKKTLLCPFAGIVKNTQNVFIKTETYSELSLTV